MCKDASIARASSGLKDGAMEGGDQQGFLAVVDLTQRKIAIEDVTYQNSIYS